MSPNRVRFWQLGEHPTPPADPRCRVRAAWVADRFEKRKRISIYNEGTTLHSIASQMLKVLIEEVCHRGSVPQAAGHGSITLVLQKLGIPTEIGTAWLGYYDNPIDDMASGESVHIMPGVDKTREDYRTAAFLSRRRPMHAG
jgi:hypothetical protein